MAKDTTLSAEEQGRMLADAFADTFEGGGWADAPTWADFDDARKRRWANAEARFLELRAATAPAQGEREGATHAIPQPLPMPPYWFQAQDGSRPNVTTASGAQVGSASSAPSSPPSSTELQQVRVALRIAKRFVDLFYKRVCAPELSSGMRLIGAHEVAELGVDIPRILEEATAALATGEATGGWRDKP